jgi:uncharacterized protein (DUF2237 family)
MYPTYYFANGLCYDCAELTSEIIAREAKNNGEDREAYFPPRRVRGARPVQDHWFKQQYALFGTYR